MKAHNQNPRRSFASPPARSPECSQPLGEDATRTQTAPPATRGTDYLEYIIRDADSYASVLSGADIEISQLDRGRLRGRHVRLDLPDGQFSYIETSLSLRGTGTFPNLWTLSVILDSETQSLQHGVEVRPGSLMIHRPGAEHDGVYGRKFKVACFNLPDDVFAKHFPQLHPQFQDAIVEPCSVFEPSPNLRHKIMERFAAGAAIIQSGSQVRRSPVALAKFEKELVCDFLRAVEQQLPEHPDGAEQRAAAMVREIDQYAHRSFLVSSSVAELCALCEVPRRTLNRAFQNALGMGPATYLRRVRLNCARRALQQGSTVSTSVTDVALGLGFWHLGRFAEQYLELFGESPHETLHREDRGVGTARARR